MSRPVDIIVPVHGAAAATRRCLESVLAARQQLPFDVVVVDDANADQDLVRYLRGEADLGRLTLLEQPVHAGFAEAVNRGAALHPANVPRYLECRRRQPRTNSVTSGSGPIWRLQ